MASFSGLPFELQTDIWTLVLPSWGGMHWIEFEGFPHPSAVIKRSLQWTDDLFDGKEPSARENIAGRIDNSEYENHLTNVGPIRGQSTPLFQYIYTTVPSVYGKSKGSSQNALMQNVLDEITATRRCRMLSTYTQVATLLLTCQTSRLAALGYLHHMIVDGAWSLYRSAGPIYWPRSLSTWKAQYQNRDIVPEAADKIVPTARGPLDIMVYRLHTASGYPKEVLKHSSYQMRAYFGHNESFPSFDRIGIEWHPLWATPDGRKELREDAVSDIVLLSGIGNLTQNSTQLYWLVDGVPRQKWDQYPPAIPAAFSRVIEKRKKCILRYWQRDQAWKDRLLKQHDLYQEFEANGRRYYIVFVISGWDEEYCLEESFRDPAVTWKGPFPGGKHLWPKELHDPVRVAYEIQRENGSDNFWTDSYCTYVLSWEPI